MLEIPFVLTAGLLGSSHCIGMCGPFALAIGAQASSHGNNLARQLVYSAGRIFTYSVLGAMAGFGGMRLAQATPTLVKLPALLAIAAGVFLLYQGLRTAGVWRKRGVAASATPCLYGGFLSTLLSTRQLHGAFLAGMATGLLPCGLLYGILGLAASSQQMLTGALLMATFGAGTVPVMVATGAGGRLLSLAARQHLLRIAAWCVVITGLITIARGIGFLPLWGPPAGCPLCG